MSDAYDMIDRFLRNNLGSDDDYAEYSKALDSLCGAQPAQAGHDGLVWREIERGADYIKMKGWVSGLPAQPLITSETGKAPDQGASAITSESGKAGQVLSDEDVLRAAARTLDSEVVEVSPLSCIKDFARAIEAAVLAKRVPQWLPIETKEL